MSKSEQDEKVARFTADPETADGKAPGATGRNTDHGLTQQSGTLVGQGDAVDTEDSAGAITETAGTTAGRHVDKQPDERE
ncbi:MAG TPA: hypothetical protein VIL85_08085 [Thermomicrobiales bacterium]|jgi:hypothetical protein